MKYMIPEENLAKVTKMVAKINRKGGYAIATITGNTEFIKSDAGIYHKCYEVEVDGFYKVDGYEFVATIEHTPEGNIIRSCRSDIEIPSYYRTCKPYCDHCETQRYRKDTYLVYNGSEFKQVGKSCLKDYTGLDANRCALISSIIVDLEEAENVPSTGSTGSGYYLGTSFKKICIELVLKYGYDKDILPRKVLNELSAGTSKFSEKTEELFDHINSYTNLINTQYSSDYESNATVAWKMEYNTMKHVNLICSWVNSCNKKFVNEQARLEAAKNFNYVGEVGDRVVFTVKSLVILYTKASYSYYGPSTAVYRIIGTDGNVYKWSTTNAIREGMKIKATIKAHSEYKGEKQNVITRGTIIEGEDICFTSGSFDISVIDSLLG